MENKRKLLSYSELSEKLSVPIGTIYCWVANNHIPHIRLSGRTVKFDIAAIDSWLASKTKEVA